MDTLPNNLLFLSSPKETRPSVSIQHPTSNIHTHTHTHTSLLFTSLFTSLSTSLLLYSIPCFYASFLLFTPFPIYPSHSLCLTDCRYSFPAMLFYPPFFLSPKRHDGPTASLASRRRSYHA
ncbi:hypothetical protein K457DRAFT_795922 [Linnemannia elongata AG-77]|uniref:Uncharacterized protein n=1 Tax=Linnemannia elongata AG-77 TaxID=1314771 RepID=A0A197JIL3_9FUNG|nr:hypothetical protein K457DRAFT_795922 [Linnemannia elongata AG-77]